MPKLFIANSLRKRADANPWLLKSLWAIEGSFVWLLATVCRLLPANLASGLGWRVLGLIGPRFKKSRLVRRNLEIAFPELAPDDVLRLEREVWGNLGAVLGEYPHMPEYGAPEGHPDLEIVHAGSAEVFQTPGKQAVFVGAHLGNWEILGSVIRSLGVPFSAIYTPLQNPFIDRMMYRMRSAMGVTLVPREGAMRGLIRRLKQNDSVGFLVDQRVDSGEPVEFFGHEMMTSVTPAWLALKFDCELVPVQVERLGGARFRVTFHEPVRPDPAITEEGAQRLDMTRRLNALFESWIRRSPGQWMCSKRRWAKAMYPRD